MNQLMPQGADRIDDVRVVISEQVDLPAGSGASYTPCTCLTHVGNVNFAVTDDDGRLMSKLTNAFFNYLRNSAL